MGATGTTTIDFGAFPGTADASVAVTGQGAIGSSSLVEAWIFPAATADHTADEHLVDPPRVVAGSVVAATGFTIFGFCRDEPSPQYVGPGRQEQVNNPNRVWGKWNVAWVWN